MRLMSHPSPTAVAFVQALAQRVDEVELLRTEQLLLAPRAARRDVDRRVDALSASERSSLISELPVPLNSSKIATSIREPVSTSAVAMIDSDPPPCCGATARAEPKNAFGRAMAVASRPPESVRPVPRSTVVCPRESRQRIEHDDDVLAVLHQTSRMLQCHLRDIDVALGGLIEARRDDHAPHSIISLTSSGRSSTRSTSSVASGWLIATPSVIAWRSIVFPARAGATINARWPKPIGAMRSIARRGEPTAFRAARLEHQLAIGIRCDQRGELGAAKRRRRVLSIDRLHLGRDHAPAMIATHRRLHPVAAAKPELPDEMRRDEGVAGSWQVTLRSTSHETAVTRRIEPALGFAFGDDDGRDRALPACSGRGPRPRPRRPRPPFWLKRSRPP